jgi:hypothetical protein
MSRRMAFNPLEIDIVNNSVRLAEELVSNHYKLSSNQWLKKKYDIKTLVDLNENEIVDGPFAQILHYKGRPKDFTLESTSFDFYKICIQDHAILSVVNQGPSLNLFPFTLYVLVHELVHIVRFSKFLQNFYASADEKTIEEKRVHEATRQILNPLTLQGLKSVFDFYQQWIIPFEDLREG